MQTFFQNNNGDELILFFNGWAMDEKPFVPLKSNFDILFIYDYTDLNLNLDLDFSKYKKINLMAFSAGAFMAAYLNNLLPVIDFKIAINGTLNMLDEIQGVPQDMFNVMENLNLDNVLDFRKKVIETEREFHLFNKYQPDRNLQSSMDELFALKKYFTKPIYFDYDKIIVGKNDRILPTKNQLKAWNNHNNVCQTEGGHFLFYNFSNFEELINI